MMKKRQTAKVVLLSILCFILVLVLGSGLLVSLTMRQTAQEKAFSAAAEKLPLAEIGMDDETVAQYILDEFIQDERVTIENVQTVMQEGTFSAFVAQLTEQYNTYLLEGGEFPKLSEEDFVHLIEENADLIYAETGLEFLDPDKQKLRDNLAPMVEDWNLTAERSMHKGVSGFAARASVSLWLPITLGVLLLILLIWMIVFHVRGGFRAGTALKTFSVALFIPGAVLALGILLADAFAGRTFPFLGDPMALLSENMLPIPVIGLLACVVLFVAGILCNLIAGKRTPVMAAEYDAVSVATEPEPAPVPEPEVQPEPQKEEESVIIEASPEPEPQRRFCRNCGKPLVNPDAKFCYQCGNVQEGVEKES